MKRLLAAILTVASMAVGAFADSTTSRWGMTKPDVGSTNWGPKINANYDIIDNAAGLTLANAFTNANSFSGQVTVQQGTSAAPSIAFIGDTNTGVFGGNADHSIRFSNNGGQSAKFDATGNFQMIASNAQIQANPGTAASPSVTFNNSLTDGMYHAGTNQVGFASNGLSSFIIDATQQVQFSTNVAMGTAFNKKRLTVVDIRSGNTTAGTNPIIWIGGGNGNTGTLSEIGFTYGFLTAYTETFSPITIGYQLTSGSGNTKGDFVVCTRSVTTDTAPTERFRVSSNGTSLQGTITNDNAPTGDFGEFVSTISAAPGNQTGTGNYDNVVSTTLAAGDYTLAAALEWSDSGLTVTRHNCVISLFSGNTTTDQVVGYNEISGSINTGTSNASGGTVPLFRVSINTPTTVYLKARSDYTGTAPTVRGALTGRRTR